MANYSYEKGKHGSVPGTIFPFPIKLNGTNPTDIDFRSLVPAGYLRCDGSILNADDYPSLANIIGVGPDCIYQKDGEELIGRDENGEGGQIQLPDLGSKYIKSSSSSGGYESEFTTNIVGTQQKRVGVAVNLSSNVSVSPRFDVTFRYTGNFYLGAFDIPIFGNFGTEIDAQTSSDPAGSETILAHGHMSNTVAMKFESGDYNPDQNSNVDGGGGYTDNGRYTAEPLTSLVPSTGLSQSDTVHQHVIEYNRPNTNISSTLDEIFISSQDISTNVTVDTDTTTAFNDVQPYFILVEYLIKI